MANQTIKIPAGATEVVVSTVDTVSAVIAVPESGVTFNVTAPDNQPPSVNAGQDITITLPKNSVQLDGTSNDPDGRIVSNLWTKISGGSASITSATSAVTTVTGLTEGSYVFRLTSTDDSGASNSDTTNVTVKPEVVIPPVGGTPTYSNSFDKSSDLNSNQLGRGTISTSIKKDGTGSFRSEVRSGDGQISGGWRSEQQYGENLSPTGKDIVVTYDELFESFPSNIQGLSVQWHGNKSGTSGQMSMWISNGKFMVQRNTTGTAGSPNIYQSGTLKTIEKNKWYNFKWEIRFSSGTDGYVRLYIDNQLYYSVTGKTSDGSGQYLKVGQNLFNSYNSVLYIDNLKVYVK